MLDRISDWVEANKGAPVLIGVALVIVNFILQPFGGVPILGILVRSNLLLHLGVIVGLLGILIGDAL
jgi:hypothetical protein